jgi:MFS family permease
MSTSAAPSDRPTLSAFWHDLPREGKYLLSTIIIDFIGNGLVMPFNVVYLHEVRGFELARVGLLLSLPALVALLVVGPVGTLIDRIGPRLVVIASLIIQIAAHITLATATTEPHAALGCVLLGFSGGIIWPAVQTLIGTIIPSHLRQRYFGVNFTLLNLGIGIGGILGGLFVDVTRPETFVAIYLIDAATFLAPLAIFLGPLRHVPVPAKRAADAPADGRAPTTGYRAVLRDRSLLLVLLIVFVASFVGYGQLNTGLPAYGREVGGISTQALGLAFAANTAVIVVLQLFVLQRIEGRRRTRMLVLMSGIWAASFVALGATGLVPGTIVAAVLFGLCAAVFGFGETFYQPTLPAMVNDLAPDHLRGRYNAVMSIAWQSASVVGPAVAGLLIGHGWNTSYIVMLVAGCVVVAWLALVAERRIPPRVNGVGDVEPAVPDAPVVPGQA